MSGLPETANEDLMQYFAQNNLLDIFDFEDSETQVHDERERVLQTLRRDRKGCMASLFSNI